MTDDPITDGIILEAGPWIRNAHYAEIVQGSLRIRRADAVLERWVWEMRRKASTEPADGPIRPGIRVPGLP